MMFDKYSKLHHTVHTYRCSEQVVGAAGADRHMFGWHVCLEVLDMCAMPYSYGRMSSDCSLARSLARSFVEEVT